MTLASKQKLYRLLDSIHGSYRKRFTQMFFIEETVAGKKQTHTLGLGELATGKTLGTGFQISSNGSKLNFTVPRQATVKKASLLGWSIIWDGKKSLLTGTDTLSFEVNTTDTITVSLGDASWCLGIQEDRPSLAASLGSEIPTAAAMAHWFKQIAKSGVAHAALLTLVLYGARMDFLWNLFKHNEPETVPVEQVQMPAPTEMDLEVLALKTLESEFNGRNVTLDGIVDRAKLSEQKSEKIANRINNALAKLGNISLEGLKFSGVQKSAQDPNAAADSLKNRMGQGQNVDLSATFKSGLKGLTSKPFQWDTSATGGKSISLKEQEEVANIFRSMHDQFRGCYESALLKDESLSVTVLFESIVSGSGVLGEPTLQVSGNSTPEGEKALNQCLTGLIHRIKVSKNLSGIKIKNQFIFRS